MRQILVGVRIVVDYREVQQTVGIDMFVLHHKGYGHAPYRAGGHILELLIVTAFLA